MGDEENEHGKQEFTNRWNRFTEDHTEEDAAQDEEIVVEIANTIDSLVDGGVVYLHGGHVEEVVNELVLRMNSTIDPYEEDEPLPPQVQGYLMGLGETARVLNFIVRGLVRKHAEEMNLPVDKLMEDIHDVLREENGE